MSDSGSQKRLRTSTEKGQEMYESTRDNLLLKLNETWKLVEFSINIEPPRGNKESVSSNLRDIEKHYQRFCILSEEYIAFLKRQHTEQSTQDLTNCLPIFESRRSKVEGTTTSLRKTLERFEEAASIRSKTSRRTKKSHSSVASSMSSVLAKSRAKAEAARVSVQFAEKEAELRKQSARLEQERILTAARTSASAEFRKAELEADLNLLAQQKDAAAAEAEFKALQSELEEGSLSQLTSEKLENNGMLDPFERTEQYVNQQTEWKYTDKIDRDLVQYPAEPIQNFDENMNTLNPNIQPFGPKQVYSTDTAHKDFTASELAHFLMKKDLMVTRLTKFNDKPESFLSWKASFSCVMKELDVSPAEELDLLAKYLGPESVLYAHSIRSANAHDPTKGLKRLWERLNERFGSPEMIEATLRQKLEHFPKLSNKDCRKLYDLCDILSEIEAIKENVQFGQLLAYYDSSVGISPIVRKLPFGIQEKWTTHAVRYKKQHDVVFPPFKCFVEFIRDVSKIKNDPSFIYETTPPPKERTQSKGFKTTVTAAKTDLKNDTHQKASVVNHDSNQKSSDDNRCPVHKTNHTLNDCRGFKAKPLDERRKFLKDNGLCFRCCMSKSHKMKDCKETVICNDCGSDKHSAALHVVKTAKTVTVAESSHGGEECSPAGQSPDVASNCTQICGGEFNGKSCGKTILVKVYQKNHPDKAILAYTMLDDQSNRSLAGPDLFALLNIQGKSTEYRLTSCSGTVRTYGRRAQGLVVESIDGYTKLHLPTLIECDNIPNIRDEIATPEVARFHTHLQDIASYIPPVEDTAPILLLIGRDLPEAHHVLEQRLGQRNSPFAQKTRLGWVIIGEVCLHKFHRPDSVTVNKTYLMRNGRTSICKPCPNEFEIKDTLVSRDANMSNTYFDTEHESCVFGKSKDDNSVGLSIDDKNFLQIMDDQVHKDTHGFWVAPLPFRSPRPKLPDNRIQALRRAKSLDATLRKDNAKREQFLTFMQKLFDNNHAEIAPTLDSKEERWYLPLFGVFHPQKPTQIRVVFDSSAKFGNISLNDTLMTGPDMTNNLLGVLLRFRQNQVAIIADIQQMFYCFVVAEEHRNFLRFFWYRDNNPENELIEFRMRVHVFGNGPSPAVAAYGLRKTAKSGETKYGDDVVQFINKNFYVDDGLISLPSASEAIDLLKRTQETLDRHGNLRLHKIASNRQEVIDAFPKEDIASNLQDVELNASDAPIQRSLGLHWNLQTDSFTYRLSPSEKPFSRRGILSVVNSLYDPLGFIAPIVIQGKLFLREMTIETKDWDEPLPELLRDKWENWRNTLQALDTLGIPRTYSDVSWTDMAQKEVHIYSDASREAIAAAAYLKSTDKNGSTHVGFIMGKAKVAPMHGHSIPRLELCAAVLGVQISETISTELGIDRESFRFYTDSKVVLGYIYNTTKRFYMYVANRVERIRKTSLPDQWSYVPTDMNPADVATRSIPAHKLQNSMWLHGSPLLFGSKECSDVEDFPLLNPEEDKEIRTNVKVLKSDLRKDGFELGKLFEKFSEWKRLISAFKPFMTLARKFRYGDDKNAKSDSMIDYCKSEQFIIRSVQQEAFQTEIECIKDKRPLPKNSRIVALNPFLDDNNMLHVGGRLTRADLDDKEKHPLIIPGNSHIAKLIILDFHSKVKHQGRVFTHGAIRNGGYWIIGEKRLISSLLHKCVICRKLRGKHEQQLMSDLPRDRLTPTPPFTSVGVDTFGPWAVLSRKTRGGQANTKRWAVLFTCLSTRAIHIEVIEELSSSSFINALRRFIALRGSVKEFRSDRGTNFVGCIDSLDIDAINVEDGPVRNFLRDKRTVWIFNPPHSSHMGGIWERMIGITRRILEAMILEVQSKNLTHEVLVTFLTEVCAIVNARPICPISSDPECPEILSPALLLTQKTGCDPSPLGTFDCKDLYKAQWRRVQYLAEIFWRRWQKEYLQTLQTRRKWMNSCPDVKEGDIVLVKDKSVARNEWPLGIIVNPLPGEDGRVRKAEVRMVQNGRSSTYTRPISEMVVLICE